MAHARTLIFTCVAFAALTACSTGPGPIMPPADPSRGMVYGNITVPDEWYLNGIVVAKLGEVYAAPFKSPPRARIYENGNFFAENLEPGRYFFMSFRIGSQVIFMTYEGIENEEDAKSISWEVKPGGVTFMGSYSIAEEESGVFSPDKFSLTPIDTPAPGAILEHLRTVTQGTGWDLKIAEALGRG